MEMIQEVLQEVAGGQRKAPSEVLKEDYRLSGLGRGHPDKDHAGDPMSFVPIFHSESTR
jgi:hypothetical protein